MNVCVVRVVQVRRTRAWQHGRALEIQEDCCRCVYRVCVGGEMRGRESMCGYVYVCGGGRLCACVNVFVRCVRVVKVIINFFCINL